MTDVRRGARCPIRGACLAAQSRRADQAEDVLKRLEADERFLAAIREGNLDEVRNVMLAHQQRVRDELETFRERQTTRLRWLLGNLDPRYYGSDIEALEKLVEVRELPHASRDELFDLVWIATDVRQMQNSIAQLGALADEATTLMEVEQSDQKTQTQITRRTAYRRGL